MTVLSKQMAFPPAGDASWQAGQGPMWRGGSAAAGWWHARAVLALDPVNARYARQGAEMGAATSVLTTTRSSRHLLTDASGVIQTFGVNTLAGCNGVGAYVGGQVTNLLTYSQEFDNAGWGKTNTSVAANTTAAPDLTTTADKIADNAVSGAHLLTGNSISFTSGASYVYSEYLKAGTQRYAQLAFPSSAFGANAYANFDLQGGAVGTAGSSASALIVALASGWYRCIIIATATSSSTNVPFFGFVTSASGARGQSYSGAGSYFYAWGGQVETGRCVTPYVPTTSAAAARYASDVVAVSSGANPFVGFSSAGLRSGLSVLAAVNLAHVGDGLVRPIAEMSDGTANNRLRFYIDADDKPVAAVVSGGSTLATARLASALTVGRATLAVNYDPANGLYLVRKTGLQSASAALSGMPSGLATLRVGSSVSGNYFNDLVEQLQICAPLTQTEANAWVAA